MAFELLLGEKGIPGDCPVRVRTAARGVIFLNNRILLNKNDKGEYLFPGGGVNPGETIIEGLRREIAQETGYIHVHIMNLAGIVVQQFQDFFDERSYFRMDSWYYYVELRDMVKEGWHLDGVERKRKVEPVFLSLEEAIEKNEAKLQERPDIDNRRLLRDTLVLKKLLRLRSRITRVYFVRHAQSDYNWEDNRTRPLTEEGRKDSQIVKDLLRYVDIDYVISSPYIRSVDTIREYARERNLDIHTDERLRERDAAQGGNTRELIRKRWENFSFHEEGGESLAMVQQRNMAAFNEILEQHPGENILIGTHGTALSTILNFYEPEFQYDSFFRIIDYMPYVIRLDFEGPLLLGQKELGFLEKQYVINPKPTIDYPEFRERNFDEKRMFTYVSGYANAHGLVQTKNALLFATQKHEGQFRKGKEKLHYIVHPLNMACHALALGITDDAIIATILLHDVCEDCGMKPEELPVDETVQKAVRYITFDIREGETKAQAKARYFQDIKNNREASIAKIIDRCNNVSSMVYGFSKKRMKEYIEETRTYVLPLLRIVKSMCPEYDNQMFLLKYHICSVLGAIEGMELLEQGKADRQ